MGSGLILAWAKWPNDADGKPAQTGPELVAVGLERLAKLTPAQLHELREQQTGDAWLDDDELADFAAEDAAEIRVAQDKWREELAKTVTSWFDGTMVRDATNIHMARFDGLNEWMLGGGSSWGDTPDGFDEVLVLSMVNQDLGEVRMHVRCWVPDYADNDPEYSPWVIGHTDADKLDDDTLGALAERYTADPSPDFADGFDTFLQDEGYTCFYVSEAPFTLETP